MIYLSLNIIFTNNTELIKNLTTTQTRETFVIGASFYHQNSIHTFTKSSDTVTTLHVANNTNNKSYDIF